MNYFRAPSAASDESDHSTGSDAGVHFCSKCDVCPMCGAPPSAREDDEYLPVPHVDRVPFSRERVLPAVPFALPFTLFVLEAYLQGGWTSPLALNMAFVIPECNLVTFQRIESVELPSPLSCSRFSQKNENPAYTTGSKIEEFDALKFGLSANVWVKVPSICFPRISFPCIDRCFDMDPWNFDPKVEGRPTRISQVSVEEYRRPSGDVKTTRFLCFFWRHKDLLYNERLEVWGEILVARARPSDVLSITNMGRRETDLAEQVLERILPALRAFQRFEHPRIAPIVFTVPGGTLLIPRVRIFKPSDDDKTRSLTARIYSFNGPSFVYIPTSCATPFPMPVFPQIQTAIQHLALPHTRRVAAHVHHRFPSGQVKHTGFFCLFRRYKKLAQNMDLNVQGEVLIMRTGDDGESVTDMPETEADLADLVAKELAPGLRAFQGDNRCRGMESLVVTVYAPDADL
ncbi:hypothetical protein R3P38DRAFT_3175008 [Favolaschia claudopus]|uniref:Uncharacterized protein n=1 Tax=Favolaschia claudopus TaxID=2862362 RepID=A0AAW0DB92_9AGAR